MKISVKGRYALSAAVCLARQYASGACVTVNSISEELGISKIYLEQVFSLLKRSGTVASTKGAQGGYRLARAPEQLSALQILSGVESPLFERTESTLGEKAPDIEEALRVCVFEPLDMAVKTALERVTLADLMSEAEKHRQEHTWMFYI